MFKTLDRMMMAGVGAMAMTRERAEQIFDEYVARGEVESRSKSGFVKEMMDSADRARSELEKVVREQTHQAVDAMNLATKDDIEKLNQRIAELQAQLAKQQEQ